MVWLIALCGCTSNSIPIPQLRVINDGDHPIVGLTVVFPDDEIEFGDIPVGGSTPYKPVPNFVYSEAVYRFRIGDLEHTQSLLDFGLPRLQRARFSYRLDFDPQRPMRGTILLLEITNDG